MCGGGYFCNLPVCPICGGMAAKMNLQRGREPVFDYLEKSKDLERFPNAFRLGLHHGLHNRKTSDENKCKCLPGYKYLCPIHGLEK